MTVILVSRDRRMPGSAQLACALDDRRMVELQREGLKFDPRLMLIQDADVPAMWYHRLKKAWADSTATGEPFVNPLKE